MTGYYNNVIIKVVDLKCLDFSYVSWFCGFARNVVGKVDE